MRAPYIDIRDASRYDVVVLGVPIDYGVSFRSGQRFGPRAIRESSFWHRLDGSVFVDLATGATVRAGALTLADLGDLALWPADPRRNNERIAQVVGEMRSAALPVVLGGDHSITYASFVGCKRALEQAGRLPVGLLHFDAHLDLEREYSTLPKIHHGSFLGELVRNEHLRGEHVVSIGARGLDIAEFRQFAVDRGIRLYAAAEVRRRTLASVLREACEVLSERCAAVYVTFDIDVVDPAQAPGTGTPVFGGLAAEDVLSAVPALKGLPMAAIDLVEVCPPFDPSGLTAVLAADLLWQVLAFGHARAARQS
jgi:agmatinase